VQACSNLLPFPFVLGCICDVAILENYCSILHLSFWELRVWMELLLSGDYQISITSRIVAALLYPCVSFPAWNDETHSRASAPMEDERSCGVLDRG